MHELACEFAWICKYLQASCIQHFNPLQPAKKILNFYLRFLGYVHTCTHSWAQLTNNVASANR